MFFCYSQLNKIKQQYFRNQSYALTVFCISGTVGYQDTTGVPWTATFSLHKIYYKSILSQQSIIIEDVSLKKETNALSSYIDLNLIAPFKYIFHLNPRLGVGTNLK